MSKKIPLEDIARVLNAVQAVTGGVMGENEKEYIRWRIFTGLSKYMAAKKTGLTEAKGSDIEAWFLSAISREINT